MTSANEVTASFLCSYPCAHIREQLSSATYTVNFQLHFYSVCMYMRLSDLVNGFPASAARERLDYTVRTGSFCFSHASVLFAPSMTCPLKGFEGILIMV